MKKELVKLRQALTINSQLLKTTFHCLLIAVITFLVFANALGNAFVLDDPSQTTNNPNVKSLDLQKLFLGSTFAGGAGLEGVYYKPLMTSAYALIYRISTSSGSDPSQVQGPTLQPSDALGESPFGFHLVQLILHIANSVLVYFIFRRVFSPSRWFPSLRLGNHLDGSALKRSDPETSEGWGLGGGWLSLFLALVFAVHPLNSESVIYISALQEPLFFFFGSLALLTIIYRQSTINNYLIFAALIFLSLLSKETGVLFLAVSVVYALTFYPSRSHPSTPFRVGPFGRFSRWFPVQQGATLKILGTSLLVFAAYLVLRYLAVGLPFSPDKPYPIMRISLFWRIMTIPAEVFYYIRNFFFPWDIAVAEHWVVTSLRFDNFYLPLLADSLFFGVILGFGYWLWRTSRWFPVKQGATLKFLNASRSHPSDASGSDLSEAPLSAFRVYFFFLTWFVLGLGLHLNLMPLDVTVADRWFYFPMVGLLGILGLIIQEFTIFNLQFSLKISNFKFQIKQVMILLGILIIVALSTRTVIRNADWKDGLTLALHDIKYSHESFPLENNLAFELINVKRFDEAQVHAEESTRLGPHWWLNFNNLGVVYRHRAMTDPAYTDKTVEAFKRAVANTGTFYMPYENLAEFLLFYKTPKEASEFIVETSKKLALNSRLLFLLAIAQYQQGYSQDALTLLASAKQMVPEDQTVTAFYNAIQAKQTIQFEKPEY